MDLIQKIVNLVTAPEVLGTAVAVVATILGALFSAITAQWSTKAKVEIDVDAPRTLEQDTRLTEVRTELARQQKLARRNGVAAGLLTFGQYIVGGVLASAFIQQSLSPNIVGLLGVLVLISSLIHQQFRPDILAAGAKRRMQQARKLVRAIEDGVYALENGQADAPTVFEIRAKATEGLAEIEENELVETDRETSRRSPRASAGKQSRPR